MLYDVSVKPTTFEQRVEVPITGLVCADKHDLDVSFSLRVRLNDTAADRAAFSERFGDEPDVGRFLIDTLRPTADLLTDVLDAADITADTSVLEEKLTAEARRALFAHGLAVLAPIECTATSNTLRRARLEAIAEEEASRRSEAQAEQLRRAAALLEDFRRTGAPVGDLLANVDAAERGGMVQNLLRASAAETTDWTLHIVSGETTARVERTRMQLEQVAPMSSALGPLRSITVVGAGRYIGAQRGVWVDHGHGPAALEWTESGGLGFNAAAVQSEPGGQWAKIVATHGEFGVIQWQLGEATRQIAAPPARCPHFLPDGRLLFSSGPEVIVDQSVITELPNEVVAVVTVDRRLAAVGADGAVVLLDANTLEVLKKFSVGKSVKHAAALPWLGSARLVLATDAGVSVIGPDDGLSLDRSVPGGCKVVAATADTIAAVTGDRQRVLLFSTWDAAAEPETIYVTAKTKHRVGDLAFSV